MKLLSILIAILISSCISGNLKGLTNGYKRLGVNEKNRIKKVSNPSEIPNLKASDTVYLIDGNQLKEFVRTQKSVVVYLWGPNCSSDICYPIHAVQDYCEKMNSNLIVIMDYFDFEKVDLQKLEDLNSPLFAINSTHYKTNFCNKYRRRFMKDLLEKEELKKEETYFRYFQFSNGKYTKCINDIMEMELK